MAEAVRTKERNDLKIKKRDYTGYDDEEFTDGRAGIKRSLLAKYDEFLEGSKDSVRQIIRVDYDHARLTLFVFAGFPIG